MALVVLAVGFVVVIVASPWLITPVVVSARDWHDLSDVGQAYGGISAILSGLAFCGIAVSLLLQWRQVRLTQLMATRERHFELVKLGIEDPSLGLPVHLGTPRTDSNETSLRTRQQAYGNLWVAHWWMLWDAGLIDSRELRGDFDALFHDEIFVEWWGNVGYTWSTAGNKRRLAFVAIADDAHRNAVAARRKVSDQLAGAAEAVSTPDQAAEIVSPPAPRGSVEGK